VQQQTKSTKQNQLPRSNKIVAVPRLNNKPRSPKQTITQKLRFEVAAHPKSKQGLGSIFDFDEGEEFKGFIFNFGFQIKF